MNDRNNEALRIDRWLWFTRFYKTRGLAADAVAGGHVRINRERAKPGNKVQAGDMIELVRGQLPFRLEVVSIPTRRGPAKEAALCYVEDADTQQKRQAIKDSIRQDRQQMPRTPGRPDKHTRRKLRDYGRGQGDPD